MQYVLSDYQLGELLAGAAEMGALVALSRTGHIPPYLKKSEAYRRYGRRNIEYWIGRDMVAPRKDGDHSACWRIDRAEAEAASKAQQALAYL